MWRNLLRLVALSDDVAALTAKVANLSTAFAQLDERINRTQAARLSAELEDLRAATEMNYRGVRRELQRVYAKLGHEQRKPEEPETPEQIRARLRDSGIPPLVVKQG